MGYTWADLYDGLEMIPFFFYFRCIARTHWVAFFTYKQRHRNVFPGIFWRDGGG
jgi:hypothetical protein